MAELPGLIKTVLTPNSPPYTQAGMISVVPSPA